MPRKETTEGENSEGVDTPEQLARFDALNTPPVEPVVTGTPEAAAPPPERYRVLRPWLPDTLAQRLNEAAADGWELAAVVNNTIIILVRAD